ncbi:glutaminase A L-glutamine amidohydrolase [Myriangium duriaei CBS 260.36]|uniref:Glutaminase A L-glutamine amidohydrolase n=1 Tax=Myriangium duriaei CBS 260.36 TaxID=1168546 RepID=A0A9P4J065_9PEZI|nr:glutaminase A L-glutamine amidohydrolase [Myriangium duriaei CBS 260.36]
MASILTPLLAALAFVNTCTASIIQPPVLPLIVRNPYLSTWLQDAREAPWNRWPMFYTGQEIGFGILVTIPDTHTTYPLLGRPHDSLDSSGEAYNVSFPSYVGSKYDASMTNLTYLIPNPGHGDPAEITLSFLSPITPTSTLRQSIPASYLTAHVTGNFDLHLYIDLNGQWVSGNRGSHIEWQLERTDIGNGEHLKTWIWKRQVEEILTEWSDRAEWGSLLFTGPPDVHHQSGVSAKLRKRFARSGRLNNEIDENYRSVMDEEPVFAFSKSFDLANASAMSSKPASDSVLFTIAHVRDPVTQYASARGPTLMRPLWKSWFSTNEALTKFHYDDYCQASKLAQNYSDQLALDAYQSGSDSYVDIVALSARQVLGATDFSGTVEQPILFMKEISSNGNAQTIDVIFPAFPFFMYTNPRWLGFLLEPHLEHMLSGQYPNDYAMHDLGTHYPNLTGHPDGKDEYMPVEECGNILIMGLALVNSLSYDSKTKAQSIWSTLGSPDVQALSDDSLSPFHLTSLETRDGIDGLDNQWGGEVQGVKQAQKWLQKSYRLWKQWTGYLVKFSLEPENQLSTDDFAGWLALQTNLALKGIIGIKAMSELANIVGEKDDAKYYANISSSYISKWEKLGISRDKTHAKLAYDWYGSWTTLYSLFADALLCFHPSSSSSTSLAPSRLFGQTPLTPPSSSAESNFIPTHIYQLQSDWYAAVMQKYGLPLDSRHLYTKSDWEFEAAAVAGPKTRKMILDRVSRWLNETTVDRPFTDLYKTEEDGGFPGPNFFARPVVGGHFAFLALERACGGGAVEGLRGLK